jgi:hypothetical protein
MSEQNLMINEGLLSSCLRSSGEHPAMDEQESERRLNRFLNQGFKEKPFFCPCYLRLKGWKTDHDDVFCSAHVIPVPFRDHDRIYHNPKTGERVYVNQPYCNTTEELIEIIRESEKFAAVHGLTASVSTGDSWHFPDWTVLVIYRSKGATKNIGKRPR